MIEVAEAAKVFGRLARVHGRLQFSPFTAAKRSRGGGVLPLAPDGMQLFCRVYAVPSFDLAWPLFEQDRHFLALTLSNTARVIGERALAEMARVRAAMRSRYAGGEIDDLARALGAWLACTTGSPFPALAEDREAWAASELGLPPEPRRLPLPGGVSQEETGAAPTGDGDPADPSELSTPSESSGAADPADAGVDGAGQPAPDDAVEPEAGQEGGLDLPTRWGGWGEPNDEAAAWVEYAYAFDADDPELRRRLLDPTAQGHPFVLLVPRFVSPAAVYRMLTAPTAERRDALSALLDRIDAYLLEGQQALEAALAEKDWETLEPLLEAAAWALFPATTPADRQLRRASSELIPTIVGWTIADLVLMGSAVVGVALGLASFGVAGAAIGAALDVLSAGIEVCTVATGNAKRDRANRFALVEHGLRVAARPESLTAAVALNVVVLLIPPIVSRALRAPQRSALALALEGEKASVLPRRSPHATSSAEAGLGDELSNADRAIADGAHASEEARGTLKDARPAGAEQRVAERAAVDAAGEDLEAEIRLALEEASVPAVPIELELPPLDRFDLSPSQAETYGRIVDQVLTKQRVGSIPKGISAPRQELLRAAEEQAAALRERLRQHWDAALPRGAKTREEAALALLQMLEQAVPPGKSRNAVIREAFFNLWRRRFVRRVAKDAGLIADLRAQTGIVFNAKPGQAGRSFSVPAIGHDGARVFIGLDVDHAAIRHADAVDAALQARDPRLLASTVDTANLQLMTARENQQVIEVLRKDARKWVEESRRTTGP
ncbi:MAG: hypothetical protein KBA72_11290 [Thermoanaerobaculia bacterium]|nr:hypothetical protein [Thermoanaerobaculia bacterium]